MVYFSDHGGDVRFARPHILGRNEGRRPFRLCRALLHLGIESWKQAHRQDYGAFLDRHYQTSHFITTWADLSACTGGFRPGESPVNKGFQGTPAAGGRPGSPKGLIDMRTMLADKHCGCFRSISACATARV